MRISHTPNSLHNAATTSEVTVWRSRALENKHEGELVRCPNHRPLEYFARACSNSLYDFCVQGKVWRTRRMKRRQFNYQRWGITLSSFVWVACSGKHVQCRGRGKTKGMEKEIEEDMQFFALERKERGSEGWITVYMEVGLSRSGRK